MAHNSFGCLLLILGVAFGDNQCSLLCLSKVCCKGTNGSLLCCPSPDGVCCESGNSCCPHGTVCNPDGFCIRVETGLFSFLNFLMSSPSLSQLTLEDPPAAAVDKVENNLNYCPLSCGSLCCPHENGVCCDDGEHCCPAGFQCDASTKSCRFSPEKKITSSSSLAVTSSGNRSCSLDDSGCSSTDTCCLLNDHTKGCCPHENAECCADGYHCCPKGTKCNAAFDGCVPQFGAWINPFKRSTRLTNQESGVKCPDGKSQCRNDSTCCSPEGVDAEYACCPLKNAACCRDGKHCCPHGTQCTPDSRACHSESTNLIAAAVVPEGEAASEGFIEEIVKCDRTKYCRGPHVTCCKMADGSWGCCPFSKAICCDDGLHCCPSGYSCDPSGRCIQFGHNDASRPLPWGVKTPSSDDDGINKCKDEKSTCGRDMTCCPAKDDAYGCCNLPDAVCCADGVHCCPNDFKCDSELRACVRSQGDTRNASIDTHPHPILPQPTCLPDSTPCFANREIGCCPLKNAICCSDGAHCCPQGFICTDSGQCVDEGGLRGKVYATAPRVIF